MSFDKWYHTALMEYDYLSHKRLGQHLMNRLSKERIDLYDFITRTEIDCFYRDDRIFRFISWVKENWDKYLVDPCK